MKKLRLNKKSNRLRKRRIEVKRREFSFEENILSWIDIHIFRNIHICEYDDTRQGKTNRVLEWIEMEKYFLLWFDPENIIYKEFIFKELKWKKYWEPYYIVEGIL